MRVARIAACFLDRLRRSLALTQPSPRGRGSLEIDLRRGNRICEKMRYNTYKGDGTSIAPPLSAQASRSKESSASPDSFGPAALFWQSGCHYTIARSWLSDDTVGACDSVAFNDWNLRGSLRRFAQRSVKKVQATDHGRRGTLAEKRL